MPVLHSEYASHSKKNISSIDQEIRNYININTTNRYEQALIEDERWDVFFQLSELRTSLLNWYEFDNNAEVLEIGAGFGALTGLLCERCAHVTTTERSSFRAEAICERYADKENLDVYAGDIKDIVFDKKFDYVILVGLLERIGGGSNKKSIYADYLRMISKLLKPSGKLLIAVENRYGIRYFCGADEPHTKRAFDGINRYPQGNSGYSFSKQELIDILNIAELKFYKFYYPLPDYKLPQLIYSENYLPEKNVGERLIPYYVNRDTLLAYENDLYDDLVDNHVFEFFANSFFVECSLNEDFCSVLYAAVSADRGREKSFATTIHTNDIVRKKPLYQQGKQNARNLYDHIMDLQAHGLKVVPHTWDEETLVMPYIRNETLSNYLKEIIKTDKIQFLAIFDRLYEYILGSSEQVSESENALCDNETRNLEWGVILKKAYMELIPLNSFYVDGEIIFFDQEFVRENYPAKYVLFRAIHYMYVFAPYANDSIPLQMLKDKYQMNEVWNIFLEEENKFLAEVRNHKLYKQFYTWASVDRKVLQRNAALLGSDDEVIADYKVSSKMKEIWNVQLKMLEAFKDVCERNDLKYFMVYGTLLGAVRHKGFIPWDDDIDIMMPRVDYEKLEKVASKEFKKPYFFQTPENDSDCFYGGFSRLRNSNTTGIAMMDFGHQCNQGIWIDILPFDTTNRDPKILGKKIGRINRVQNLLYAKIYGKEIDSFRNMSKWKWKIYCGLAKLFSHQSLCMKMKQEIAREQNKEDKYLAIFTHYNSCMVFDKRDFESTVFMDFAHLKLPAPVGYKRCLEMSVGKDYMVYPPIEERKPHHRGIFNTEISYQTYNDIFMGTFDDIEDKTIVLFGAGFMFEHYMKEYGKQYVPQFMVDNDEKKWGKEKGGIITKSPEEILKIPKDKLRLIICSFYYRQIEEQLKKMGIDKYKVYIQRKDWILEDEEKGR